MVVEGCRRRRDEQTCSANCGRWSPLISVCLISSTMLIVSSPRRSAAGRGTVLIITQRAGEQYKMRKMLLRRRRTPTIGSWFTAGSAARRSVDTEWPVRQRTNPSVGAAVCAACGPIDSRTRIRRGDETRRLRERRNGGFAMYWNLYVPMQLSKIFL